MPILDVRIVGRPPEGSRERLAARLAEAAGSALSSRVGGTWVTVTHVDPADYAENGGGPAAGVEPVFVRVLKRSMFQGDALEAEIDALTRAVAEACGRPPEHVHVLYDAPAAGRVAFGGKLVQ